MSEDCRNWYAVHVRSKHDFIVNEALSRKSIETFLPVVERLRQWKDRKKVISFPLFPGYIFVNIENTAVDILDVQKTRGVVRILGNDKIIPIPDEQIETLKYFVECKEEIDEFPFLKEGQRVKVVSGPLAGAIGIFLSKGKKGRLVLSMDILQKSVSVQVDSKDVEPIFY